MHSLKKLFSKSTIFKFWGRKKPGKRTYEFNSVGEGVILADPVNIYNGSQLRIGNYVYIGKNTSLYGKGEIFIGDHTIISSEVIILSAIHNYENAEYLPYDHIDLVSPVVIGRCCWIGIRTIILPGVQLDDGCIVGAGSVVTKSFEKGSIIAGNPARLIKYRDLEHFETLDTNCRYYLKEKLEKGLNKIDKRTPSRKYSE